MHVCTCVCMYVCTRGCRILHDLGFTAILHTHIVLMYSAGLLYNNMSLCILLFFSHKFIVNVNFDAYGLMILDQTKIQLLDNPLRKIF